uniref:Uncharacterized protein n=1 Tax=Oryza rufipogon TaxID=4529 RepID=A0A0E0PY26_ORYRU
MELEVERSEGAGSSRSLSSAPAPSLRSAVGQTSPPVPLSPGRHCLIDLKKLCWPPTHKVLASTINLLWQVVEGEGLNSGGPGGSSRHEGGDGGRLGGASWHSGDGNRKSLRHCHLCLVRTRIRHLNHPSPPLPPSPSSSSAEGHLGASGHR